MPDLTDKRFIYRPQPPEGKKYLQHKMQKLYFYRATSKDPQIKGADGGMSWRGANGTFKREFWGDAFYNDFGGLKSYFFINDRIYALGSNIKSDNKKYHVQTNLYQKVLRKKDDPTYVDGKEIKTFPVDDQALDSKKPHYLVDPVGNGYYVPSGQKVFTARKHQKSRTTKYFKSVDHEGDFATAWLEHGVGCQDGRYVYVVMPYCDREKLAKFSDKDFEILQQDDFAHILHDKIDGFYAGIFFKGGKVSKLPHVAEVERSCQIMYQKKDGKLVIAVGDPDPHRYRSDKLMGGGASRLTPLKVTFDKKWRLAEPVDGVKILNSGKDKTIIEFTCIHGKSFDFILTE